MKPFLILFICSVVLVSCGGNKVPEEMEIKPLSETGFIIDSLPGNTPVNIIGWSGSLKESKDAVYLEQFLVIDKDTHDTVRVLSRFISKTGSDGTDILIHVNDFDMQENAREAVYKREIDDENIIDAVTRSQGTNNAVDIASLNEAINDSSEIKRFVVMNKKYPVFSRTYKTVLGILHFNTKP